MIRKLTSFSIEVEDFALVTHRVPAERVRRVLPDRHPLQSHWEDGREYCFVSATCFRNRDFRPTALAYPRHTFYESTYRTYITYKDQPAVYFFGRYLETPLSHVSQRLLTRDTYQADFDVEIEGGHHGYDSYVCRTTSRQGDTSFAIEATDAPPAKSPWASGDEHAQFLTFRPFGCYTSSVAIQGRSRVEHARLRPWSGTLRSARFDLWEELGIVLPDEASDPYSVLIDRGTRFLLFPPLPTR